MISRAALLAVLALAACAPQDQQSEAEANPPAATPEQPAGQPPDVAGATPGAGDLPALPLPQAAADDEAFAAAQNAPHIYMALQPSGNQPTSIVFAIDHSRDATPANDPAIRLTPQDGKCNPQELRSFKFPGETGNRPIFGPDEAFAGVTAKDLPAFMAMAVTSEMLRQDLIAEPDESQPQNVCTRKLWERLIVNQAAQG